MLYLMSIFCGLLSLGTACSPEGQEYLPRHDDLVGKTYYSHAVVMGRIVNLIPTHWLSPRAYTVTMQVDCIIKDIDGKIKGNTPVNINITEAGFIEGMCHSAEFSPGLAYIAFLREDHSRLYKPWESPATRTPANEQLVMTTCGLNPVGNCPSAPYGPCTSDIEGYASDQATHAHDMHGDEHDHGHGDEHHEDHYHHGDEDLGFSHAHADHHLGDEDFDHDHDHSDHHHDDHDHDHDHDHSTHHDHDHDHHGDEDSDLGHSHEDHHDGTYDHDHDHSAHHDTGHRDVMSVLSTFVILVVASVLQ